MKLGAILKRLEEEKKEHEYALSRLAHYPFDDGFGDMYRPDYFRMLKKKVAKIKKGQNPEKSKKFKKFKKTKEAEIGLLKKENENLKKELEELRKFLEL